MECSFNSCSQAFAPILQAVADGASWTIDKVSIAALGIFDALSSAAIWAYTHGANALQGVVTFFGENQAIVIPVALGIGAIALAALGIVIAKNLLSSKSEEVEEPNDKRNLENVTDDEEVSESEEKEEVLLETEILHDEAAAGIHAELEEEVG